MKLSVLIPTLPETYSINMLSRLNKILDPQIAKHSDKVEKIIHDAGRSMPTGQKRNELIARAEGEYFIQIDSDDVVSDNYVEEILNAIEQGPDVVTFRGYITEDRGQRKNFVIKLNERYEERTGVYYRYPNHLCAFKKSVVQHVKFPHIHKQEDYQWATAIHNAKLLKTEVHIAKDLYWYDFISPTKRIA